MSDVELDLVLNVEDVVGPAHKGSRAVDGLMTSFDHIEKKGKSGAMGLDFFSNELGNLQGASGSLLGSYALGGVVDRFSSLGKMGSAGGPIGMLVAAGAAFAALDLAVVGLAVGGLVTVAEKFSMAAIEAGKFAQESELAISALLHGNIGEAANQFDDVRQMAVGLGLDVHNTVEQFQSLLRAQFDVGQSKDLVRMAADMQSVGAKATEVESILLAMSQIKSIGKLQGQDLRQIEQAGIAGKLVMEELQKSMHLGSIGDVQKSMQSGGISADVGISAIESAVMRKTGESALGQAGANFAGNSLTGMWSQMKGEFSNLMIDAGREMMPGLVDIMQTVKGSFDDLMKSPELTSLGATLKEGWEEFVGWFKEEWPSIKEKIPSVFEAIDDGAKKIIKAFEFVHEHWEGIKTGIEVGGIVIAGALATVGVIGGAALLGLAIAAEAVALPFEMIAFAVWAIDDAVEGLWAVVNGSDWSTCGSTIIEGIVNGMESAVPDWLAPLLGIDNSSVGINADLGKNVGSDAGSGMPTVRSGASAAAAAISNVSNVSNVKGDSNLQLNLTVPAPPGGTEADGESYGSGIAGGLHKHIIGFFSGAGENAA